THLAFQIDPPVPPAVAAAASPFQQMRTTAAVAIPAGTPVRSVPAQGEQSQVFETVRDVVARPEWSLMRPVTTVPASIGSQATFADVAVAAAGVPPGDMLLFEYGQDDWHLTPVTSATPAPATGSTRLTWAPGVLAEPGPYRLSVFRKVLAAFGSNAPP